LVHRDICANMQYTRWSVPLHNKGVLDYIYGHFCTLSSPPAGRISAMSNISIFQPEGSTSSGPIALPHSFVVLKNTDTGSRLFLPVLRLFLKDKVEGRQTLKQLRGSAAAEVADFLDTVRKPDVTTISSCGRPTFL
jgi:hypothetical protein